MSAGQSYEAVLRYTAGRRTFYARFPEFWADTNGREYAHYGAYPLSAAEADSIRLAAAAIWRIYTRVANLVRNLSDEALLLLGLPEKTLQVARTLVPGVPETVIGRVDMVRTPDGYKLLELNADTPYLLYECFRMNGLVCDALGKRDVNEGDSAILTEALGSAILASLQYLGRAPGDPACVAFASHGSHSEDRGSAEYLHGLVALPAPTVTRYTPLDQLRIDSDGLYTGDGQRIDVLYRLYPLEYFAADRDPASGADVGAMLLDLVRRRRLALINPPSAFLMQSKAVQAAIWGLYESRQHFSPEERALVAAYFLPTYLDPVFEGRHVVSSAYGREGDTVSIVNPATDEVVVSPNIHFAEQPSVYQQYIEMPETDLMTEKGVQRLKLLTSCFLIGGRPCGIGFRAGGVITDVSAYYLPAALDYGHP